MMLMCKDLCFMQALIMFYARFGISAEAVVGILAEEIVDAKTFTKY